MGSMKILKQVWVVAIILVIVSLGGYLYYESQTQTLRQAPAPVFKPKTRVHLDHSSYFTKKFTSPQEVTRACLECHPQAATDFMKTSHWQWVGPEEKVPGRPEPMRIGKRNLLNNFCIGIQGNWAACTKCHAGYSWDKADYDFGKKDNIDCLVCHDWSGTYIKGPAGVPDKKVDLLVAAKSVGYPKRENCGTCHNFGGGGEAVKHGDLDTSLDNPSPEVDIHMGKAGFLCIDCHVTKHHQIPGRAFSVSTENANGISCTDCHQKPHQDDRLNQHLAKVACVTCHIPYFARNVPTKMFWDWSKAGDSTRPEDPHHYLKIKGEFTYANNVIPDYYWFNLTVNRYLVGDKTNPSGPTDINRPLGSKDDPKSQIWPFKVHRAKQPYDKVNDYLLPVVTAGPGGFWHEFNWNKAVAMGADLVGLKYSGQYGFTETAMYWPLTHGVVPKGQALSCSDCHGSTSRLNWPALGYPLDPMKKGGQVCSQ
jgi:octaheme c-type cytochrome (tetrathionate reductase family)